MLMEKLPSFMVNWVIEAEEKLAQNRPTVHFVKLHGMGVVMLLNLLKNLPEPHQKK